MKLVAAVKRVVTDIVPEDPNRSDFWLGADLAKFRRVKRHGLPERYRLFYVFSSTARTVIYLYLNDEATLRKAGAATDAYGVFAGMVAAGRIGADLESNYAQWQGAHRQHADRSRDDLG